MNNRYDSIVALRAIRQFDDRPLSEDDLAALLKAAQWTGSSKNRQNWSFIVVDDPDQKDRLCDAGDFTTPIRNAPAAICLVQEPDGYEFDTGRLAQNIMLAADALGLGSCPITLHREEVAAEVLGLPEESRCRYAIAIGYKAPGAGPTKMGGRKLLHELVHHNTYGG
ncbi:MAG: nitroreductase family protein [Actinomycetota bacterium]